ncbi:MAG: HD family phosphohydrolase, partial [Candidatus Tectomicrobia bacterium]|nr:HD family phosphohydrolase [Candidatus Tectomicrobia bacterium]
AYLLERSREDYLFQQEKFEASLKDQLAEIDEMLTFLIQTNMPAILPEEGSKRLQEIAQQTYLDLNGNSQTFLDPHEVINLSIRKGSLNEEERREIESHATHTFLFLRQIPWTKGMRGIPNIAYGHHEKLNGEGYPRGIKASEIPIQTRIMTISDIFDALTAADRPYKKALPKERALDILGYEVKDNHIDPDLVNLFIEAKIYDLTNKEP